MTKLSSLFKIVLLSPTKILIESNLSSFHKLDFMGIMSWRPAVFPAFAVNVTIVRSNEIIISSRNETPIDITKLLSAIDKRGYKIVKATPEEIAFEKKPDSHVYAMLHLNNETITAENAVTLIDAMKKTIHKFYGLCVYQHEFPPFKGLTHFIDRDAVERENSLREQHKFVHIVLPAHMPSGRDQIYPKETIVAAKENQVVYRISNNFELMAANDLLIY